MLAAGGVFAYTTYHSQEEKEEIAQRVHQQEKAIIELQTLNRMVNQKCNSRYQSAKEVLYSLESV